MASSEQESGESVLSRWSRRKRDAEQPTRDAEPSPQVAMIDPEPRANDPAPVEAPPLTDADMPDLETLSEDSDFTGFMSPGVSDELRNLALRKLFHAPVFNLRDGLDEYDEDYTSFEKLGDIVTCDMKHRVEMQQKKLREAMERDAEAAEQDAGALEQDAETAEQALDQEIAANDVANDAPGDAPPAAAAPRKAGNGARQTDAEDE